METRQIAHQLVDSLPEAQLSGLVQFLETIVSPLSKVLASAPTEEEEITPETAAALQRARASLARGEVIPHEEIRREAHH